MRSIVRVMSWVFLAMANFIVAEWLFELMSFPSDLTFFAGVVGLVLLLCVDGLIVVRALKRYGFTGEDL